MSVLLPRGLPFGWRGVGVFLFAVLLASVLLEPGWVEQGPTICAFRLVTGRPCPGCGLIRSFTAMGSGDVGRAFLYHPFGPLLFAGAVLGLLAIAWRAVTGRWPVAERHVSWIPHATLGLLVVWIGWAAARVLGLVG